MSLDHRASTRPPRQGTPGIPCNFVHPTMTPGTKKRRNHDDDEHRIKSSSVRVLFFWYLFFGALHEMAHMFFAMVMGVSQGMLDDGLWTVVFRTIVARQCVVPSLLQHQKEIGSDDGRYIHPFRGWTAYDVVRHSGWFVSVLVAILVCTVAHNKNRNRRLKDMEYYPTTTSPFLIAALITAIEAVSTDLLGIVVLPLFTSGAADGRASLLKTSCTFFCGNFGIILINSMWIDADGGNSALNVLEKMANVTMMRGAQSGGVVTFVRSKEPKLPYLAGIRSRVVNRKRSDLSKCIRTKVHRDVFSRSSRFFKSFSIASSDLPVKTFVGHTRFATTSKASFDGTHPHRWTPPAFRRVYNFNLVPRKVESRTDGIVFPANFPVENYITHNGDIDFYEINGICYELETIQKWLVIATGVDMPATVDSAVIAGLVDLLRTQGCFGLSARYAVCFGLSSSKATEYPQEARLPAYETYERIGTFFEEVLNEMLQTKTVEYISSRPAERHVLAEQVLAKLESNENAEIQPLSHYINDEEEGSSLFSFVKVTVDAFFDNDLLNTMKTLLANATGSFGLCITSSLDAHKQICLAARGQTMSIAFYPQKGLICYGSEQAAVKAGMNINFPGYESHLLDKTHLDYDNDALRLDLDDLGGEICLLDWSGPEEIEAAVSPPNRSLPRYKLMHGKVNVFLLQESKTIKQSDLLYHRMTRLTRNDFVKPLQEESHDLVLKDIQDIPRVCRAIQNDWRNIETSSLNRLTAWNLARCIRQRMQAHVDGSVHSNHGTVDVLLTGCEVSLWLAEQFASDLQKAFPKLGIKAVSSNKLLGLYGQEMCVPATGFPMSQKTHNIKDAIMIIVSHSGGTFAPLACSSLLQSTTKNIFVVTSEWDTQIGKQLRSMDKQDDQKLPMFNSRIFTTEVGLRPAEPCSISVAAMQQLLTNIFEHICIVMLSNPRFRHISGAVITERDLQVLERCNQENLIALEKIVGADSDGNRLPESMTQTEKKLRELGDRWSEHVLENAKAYILTFIYIIVTVTCGYPLVAGVATAAGLTASWAFYLARFFDGLIYFFLPQINVMILRLVQKRNMRHRMVGRTVVIADVPWVSQAAEAFLSRLFACSYSIAGLNVLSGNPADHFVHRHTHRVTRGTLVVCGRPDGRLSALSSLEASTCLSVNQASSIQSLGSTCESITIGHNPFKLPLSADAVFLDRSRPLFLCERILDEMDAEKADEKNISPATIPDNYHLAGYENDVDLALRSQVTPNAPSSLARNMVSEFSSKVGRQRNDQSGGNMLASMEQNRQASKLSSETSRRRSRVRVKSRSSDPLEKCPDEKIEHGAASRGSASAKGRSSTALIGAYKNLEKQALKQSSNHKHTGTPSVDDLVEKTILERKWSDSVRKLFDAFDTDGDGTIDAEEFVEGFLKLNLTLSREQLFHLFEECNIDDNERLDFNSFLQLVKAPQIEIVAMLQASNRDSRGLIQVEASKEKYFGEKLRKEMSANNFMNFAGFSAIRSQYFSQELYESRIASLQRFVAMAVMFHHIGYRVQSFFRTISFGYLGYRMDRTHSIMRIATTASPVSGADVRQRMHTMQVTTRIHHSIQVISAAWSKYKQEKKERRLTELENIHASSSIRAKHFGDGNLI